MVQFTKPENMTHRPYHKYPSSDYMDDGTLRSKLEIDVIPEPCSAWLLAFGLAVLGVLWRLRRR